MSLCVKEGAAPPKTPVQGAPAPQQPIEEWILERVSGAGGNGVPWRTLVPELQSRNGCDESTAVETVEGMIEEGLLYERGSKVYRSSPDATETAEEAGRD